jgi:peptide/nickel transport system ATP-binding protein
VKILEVQNLVTEFPLSAGILRAVDGVSFTVEKGKILGLVGESGSGKTVTALSLLRLVDPPGRITEGKILFHRVSPVETVSPFLSVNPFETTSPGLALPVEDPLEKEATLAENGPLNLLELPEKEILKIRGAKIAMIFQEPMTSLNPVYTVGDQIEEPLRLHQGLSKREARKKAIDLLDQVGIPDAARRINDYPHQMSGGMRQRVMIAMALSCEPEILIADEPTTALDVTIQAQILELIRKIVEDRQMAMILITHDLGVVAETCDQVLVMYAGKVVEEAPVRRLFRMPKHHYTIGLIRSIPNLRQPRGEPLAAIPGTVPDLLHLPPGCRFRDRCPRARPACDKKVPDLRYKGAGQWVRCINT